MTGPPLIAHVIHHLFIGGMENGLVNLINRIPSNRYRHCVICAEDFSDFRDRIERPDVQVFALKKSALTTVQLYRHTRALFKELRPTIVHSRNLSGLDALLPACAARVPIRIHGEHGWDMQDLDGSSLKPRLLRRLHRPMVHHYVTVSRELKNYLVAKVGVSPSRITQICNGVDVERFTPGVVKPIGIMPPTFYGLEKIVIGTVGRLQQVKDQLTLVRAFGQLLRDEPRLREVARLAIIGDGPLRDALKEYVRDEGLADVIWIPGARSDVAPLYQCLDVFVSPSLKEGISNTVLEAMATGLPIIATRVGGNLELVQDNVNGRLVPVSSPQALASEMGRYIRSVELRLRHGKAGRQRAIGNFGVDAMVDSYVRLYDSLVSGSSESRFFT